MTSTGRPVPTSGLLSRLRGTVLRTVPPQIYWFARRLLAAFAIPWISSYRSGHLRSSLTGKIVDKSGNPLPWYTYPAIDFLSTLPLEGRQVLEFGAGYSTQWWAQRAEWVDSYEADSQWLEKLTSQIPANATVRPLPTLPNGEAPDLASRLSTDLQSRTFDVIVIDGADRARCAELAPAYLKPDGVIIFDNSDTWSAKDPGMLVSFHAAGFQRVDFYGMAPGNLFPHCTSLFFKSGSFAVAGQQATTWLKPFDRSTYADSGVQSATTDIRN